MNIRASLACLSMLAFVPALFAQFGNCGNVIESQLDAGLNVGIMGLGEFKKRVLWVPPGSSNEWRYTGVLRTSISSGNVYLAVRSGDGEPKLYLTDDKDASAGWWMIKTDKPFTGFVKGNREPPGWYHMQTKDDKGKKWYLAAGPRELKPKGELGPKVWFPAILRDDPKKAEQVKIYVVD